MCLLCTKISVNSSHVTSSTPSISSQACFGPSGKFGQMRGNRKDIGFGVQRAKMLTGLEGHQNGVRKT